MASRSVSLSSTLPTSWGNQQTETTSASSSVALAAIQSASVMQSTSSIPQHCPSISSRQDFPSIRYGDLTPQQRREYRQSFYQKLFLLLPSKDEAHRLPFKTYGGSKLKIYKDADAIVIHEFTGYDQFLSLHEDGSCEYTVYFRKDYDQALSEQEFVQFRNESDKISDVVKSDAIYFELDKEGPLPKNTQFVSSYMIYCRKFWMKDKLSRYDRGVSLMELLYQKSNALALSLIESPAQPHLRAAEYFASCIKLLKCLQENTHPILHEANASAICNRAQGTDRSSITYGPLWNSAIAPETSQFEWTVEYNRFAKTIGLISKDLSYLDADCRSADYIGVYTTDTEGVLRIELTNTHEYSEHSASYESSAYLVSLQENGSLSIVPAGARHKTEEYYVEYNGTVHLIDSSDRSWQQKSDQINEDSKQILGAMEQIYNISNHPDTILLQPLRGGYQTILGQMITPERLRELTYRYPQHLLGIPAPAETLQRNRITYERGHTSSSYSLKF